MASWSEQSWSCLDFLSFCGTITGEIHLQLLLKIQRVCWPKFMCDVGVIWLGIGFWFSFGSLLLLINT